MVKYYFDTEFLEGPQTKRFMGIPVGKTPPTIDLISIGMVDEKNRSIYLISKDFNLDEAWNRFQKRTIPHTREATAEIEIKEYWIRENVLRPIHEELCIQYMDRLQRSHDTARRLGYSPEHPRNVFDFTYRNLKWLINKFGYSRADIANHICGFIYGLDCGGSGMSAIEMASKYDPVEHLKPEFYAYFADYDWVVFCWIFGNMMQLPKGFPKYCRDLKQMLDQHLESKYMTYLPATGKYPEVKSTENISLKDKLNWYKSLPGYPKNDNEHSALADAKWNKELFETISKH